MRAQQLRQLLDPQTLKNLGLQEALSGADWREALLLEKRRVLRQVHPDKIEQAARINGITNAEQLSAIRAWAGERFAQLSAWFDAGLPAPLADTNGGGRVPPNPRTHYAEWQAAQNANYHAARAQARANAVRREEAAARGAAAHIAERNAMRAAREAARREAAREAAREASHQDQLNAARLEGRASAREAAREAAHWNSYRAELEAQFEAARSGIRSSREDDEAPFRAAMAYMAAARKAVGPDEYEIFKKASSSFRLVKSTYNEARSRGLAEEAAREAGTTALHEYVDREVGQGHQRRAFFTAAHGIRSLLIEDARRIAAHQAAHRAAAHRAEAETVLDALYARWRRQPLPRGTGTLARDKRERVRAMSRQELRAFVSRTREEAKSRGEAVLYNLVQSRMRGERISHEASPNRSRGRSRSRSRDR